MVGKLWPLVAFNTQTSQALSYPFHGGAKSNSERRSHFEGHPVGKWPELGSNLEPSEPRSLH